MKRAFRVKARMKGCGGYVNCMRPTLLQNPYPVEEFGLLKSLELFTEHLRYETRNKYTKIYKKLEKLAVEGEKSPVYLGCTCAHDHACHTDILADFINNMELPV